VAAAHWLAADQAALGEWLLRADAGFTGRANSALPLGDPGIPLAEAVGRVEQWYLGHGLPPMIAIPGPLPCAARPGDALDGLLAGRGWRVRSGPAVVMTAELAAVAGPDVAGPDVAGPDVAGPDVAGWPTGAGSAGPTITMAAWPDQAWLGRYHYRGTEKLPASAVRLLLSAPWQAFASVIDGGQTVAIGRVSVAAGWAGITAIDVAPGHRRKRLGTTLTRALAAAAARRGAGRVFLQVEEDNVAARALYERCGFAAMHRYHYRVAPVPGAPS
jgi:ribosomal protein S18 acetylase RimI-like enzyme